MDEFTLPIDEINFRSTNGSWNYLCLNDPWSVGYVSTLIETQTLLSKEQWEQFYYDSGQERQLKIQTLNTGEQMLLNDHTLKQTNIRLIDALSLDLKNLNFLFGRTKEQLVAKAKILHQHVSQNGIDITVAECIECVRYRTICETWNGIIIRERNTVKKLKEIFPNLEFTKTNGDFDHKYAVDYELSIAGKIFGGIQIKPKTYTYNTTYITKARNANTRKNREYSNTFHRPVFDIVSQANGEIINIDVINQIKTVKN